MKQYELILLLCLSVGPACFAARPVDELVQAAADGDLTAVKACLADGGDVNASEPLAGRAPLMAAASEGRLEVAKFLVERGADLTRKDSSNWTALMLAARNDRADMVRFLLEKGADPNVKNELGWTPLMFASLYGHQGIVSLLLEHKADPDVTCSDGRTALMYAVGNDHVETVRILLEKKADPSLKDANGLTVLMYAEKESNAQIVELLKTASPKKAVDHDLAGQGRSPEAAPPSMR